jgi:hypothetical protein
LTDAQLRASAAAYDPAKHEAPIVIGHPKTNAPAYGWINKLDFTNGDLNGDPQQVDAAFAELHNGGKFKKHSAAFYGPDDPNNPVPGVYYLRHVGFLGAQPPAIKGLRDYTFEENSQSIEIEFEETKWTWRSLARALRGMRDWLIEKEGLEKADDIIPDYLITDVSEAAVDSTSTFSEPEPKIMPDPKKEPEFAERETALQQQAADIAAKDADIKAREDAIAAREAQARRADTVAFCETLIAAGKVLPRDKDNLVEFMAALPAAEIEFAEGDAKVKKTSDAWLRNFLTALPKQVEFAELSPPGDDGQTALPADPVAKANELARRAVEFQETEAKAGRTVSVDVAVTHVSKLAQA